MYTKVETTKTFAYITACHYHTIKINSNFLGFISYPVHVCFFLTCLKKMS